MSRKIMSLLGLVAFAFLMTGCATLDVNGASTDPSASILSDIFLVHLSDALNGTLPSGGTITIFGLLIKTFNTILLGASLLIFAYVTFMGVLYTAQDGVFLGKKWSKTFIPIRAVLGILFIFPLGASGFGIAQWIIYWMTYVGIAGGDMIWSKVDSQINSQQGVTPVIPGSMADNINNGIAIVIFNDLLSDLIPAASQSTPASFPAQYVNRYWLNQISSKLPASSGNYQSNYINAIAAACQNPAEFSMTNGQFDNNFVNGCNFFAAQAQYNLTSIGYQNGISDPQYDDILPMNLNFSTPGYGTTMTLPKGMSLYIESLLKMVGSSSATDNSSVSYTLTKLMTSSQLESLIPSDYQPAVEAIYTNETGFLNLITAASPASGQTPSDVMSNESSSYQNLFGQVIDSLKPPSGGNNPSSGNLTGSWWDAGNEYLYLDAIFNGQIEAVSKFANIFYSTISKNINPTLTLGPNVNLVLGISVCSPSTSASGGQNADTTAEENACTSADDVGVYSTPIGNIAISPQRGLALQKLMAMMGGSNPPTGNLAKAINGLICRLGGDPGQTGACKNSWTSSELPAGNVMSPLNLNQAPYNIIEDYLDYYFLASSVNSSNQNQIYQLGLGLEAVVAIVNSSAAASGVPAGGGQNPNNPVVIAGSGSSVGGVMGFLFSDLLGNSSIGGATGGNAVAGLLGQVWCVGEADFGACIQQVQSNPTAYPSSSSTLLGGSLPPGGSLVSDHFSAIGGAQYVGVNLITGTIDAMLDMYNNFKSQVSAIIQSQTTGVSAGALFGASILPAVGSALSSSIVNSATQASVELASISVELMWLPLILVVLTALFTTGIMFALFIPLVPFVLFWAGKVAWLFMVLEAMIAVPVMALGVAYPEGHDLWGMGEQGFKISLNLLIFPMLLIVGLVSAMVVTYVVLNFSAGAFHLVSLNILNLASSFTGGANNFLSSIPAKGGALVNPNVLMVNGVMATFMILLYATFISMAFNKCFSLIYIIPEKVMSWIGGQGIKFGEKEAEEMKSAATQQANQVSQAGGQSLTQGMQGQKSVGDAQIQQGQQDSQQEIQVAQSVQQTIQQAAATAATAGGGG